MREIKFRALVKYGSQDEYRWEYYSTLCEPTWADSQIAHIKIKDLQFTGLKDKNGKEIFEGDIIRVQNQGEYKEQEEIGGVGTVEYLDGRYGVMGFYFIGLSQKTCSGSEGNWNMEIIGDIYSNPELLKV